MKKSENSAHIYFFIGTEAEFIKLFPILLELNNRRITYKIIASGQNNIEKSELLRVIGRKSVDFVLFRGNIKQTPLGLIMWFVKTLPKGTQQLWESRKDLKKSALVIHGDTVSTVMGAIIGKIFRMKLIHVEAGLRSYNFLQPFPEELDRVIASRFVSVHFCPNSWAMDNIKNLSGKKINTYQNTLFDSLQFILKHKSKQVLPAKFLNKPFFIFIMHRQENLYDKKLSKSFLNAIAAASEEMNCYFILHNLTKNTLHNNELLQIIENKKNIYISGRLTYPDFIHLLHKSSFIITDGGSNQEESSYLGKPALILRSVTERIEGLGENVVLNRRADAIQAFVKDYKKYKRKPIFVRQKPSVIIADYLANLK